MFAAHRVDGRWVLRCPALPGVEISVASLTSGHDRARAAVAEATGAPTEEIEVRVAPILPARAAQHLENARDLKDEIHELTRRAERELAAGVQQLLADDLSRSEVSVVTGLPVYRVRQLADAVVDDSTPLTERAMNILREHGALRPER